jgi:hypothetical protein
MLTTISMHITAMTHLLMLMLAVKTVAALSPFPNLEMQHDKKEC